MSTHTDFDVAVVGAGPVGLAFAGWLALAWGERAHRIALFDAKPLDHSAQDPRVLALADATRLRLTSLAFPNTATPIHHIHVSEQGSFGQVRMKSEELGLRALGWTVRYGELVNSLAAAVEKRGVQVFRPAQVRFAHRSATDSLEVLELDSGQEYTVNLRVDAEGGLYGEAGERDQVVDYAQWALVSEVSARVEPSLLQGGNTLAFERFTSEGPLALLPISQDQARYSLVWCAPKALVEERMGLPDQALMALLHQQFGRRVRVLELSHRKAFPLGMNWRDKLVQGRRVAIGNAAQILHPVAGQGLNLGLRDAAQLTRCIDPAIVADEHRLCAALDEFERARVVDRRSVVKMTDWMVKGFSNSNPLLGAGRQMALNVMEFTPPLRKQFAELMLFGLAV
ncbi:FAD-dependent monooxygenase [Limnobacter sp.]|uniref:FAD-dependent monooxygenase n=1 Tax=Limnobacter sp. TaxID=2003368 RepID=UPI003514894E